MENMMRTTRDVVERLLVEAHAIRLVAHRSTAVAADERLHLDECIGRFEAAVLLGAPSAMIAESGHLLDVQIARVEERLRSRESPAALVGSAWACAHGLAAPR
jgi:hypothetical protein